MVDIGLDIDHNLVIMTLDDIGLKKNKMRNEEEKTKIAEALR